MRLVLIIALMMPPISQAQEDHSQFQHQGITKKAVDDACKELGDKCKENSDHSASQMEEIMNKGLQAAFSFLVPLYVMKMFKSDGFKQVKNLWNFKEIGSQHYIAKAQELIGKKAEKASEKDSNTNKRVAKRIQSKNDEVSNHFLTPEEAKQSLQDKWDKMEMMEEDVPSPAQQQVELAAAEKQANENLKRLKTGDTLKKICKLMTIGGVAAVWAKQKTDQQTVQDHMNSSSATDSQAETLYAISELHKAKSGDSKHMRNLFGVIGACYTTVFIIKNKFYFDTEAFIAAGLSTFVAAGYQSFGSKHKEIAEKARSYADAIPKKGTCRPGSFCFCIKNEELSKLAHAEEYAKYCVGQRTAESGFCLDRFGRYDEECACRLNDNCVDRTILNAISANGGSAGLAKRVIASTRNLSRGNADANLAQHSQNVAYSQAAMKKYDNKMRVPRGIRLNDNQKKIAQEDKRW